MIAIVTRYTSFDEGTRS